MGMHPADEKLTNIFDLALRNGVSSLSDEDRSLYYIQDFIIEYEMGGLSGYLYNRIRDREVVDSAIMSMRLFGLLELADLLHEVASFFVSVDFKNSHLSWSDLLDRVDPAQRIAGIEKKIERLDRYGIPTSRIC